MCTASLIPIIYRLPNPASLQVKKACAATYMFRNSGTCLNIRVARSSQPEQHIVENIKSTLAQAVKHIPKQWSNVQVR